MLLKMGTETNPPTPKKKITLRCIEVRSLTRTFCDCFSINISWPFSEIDSR